MNRIKDYINGQSRNKIIVSKHIDQFINPIDIGATLSPEIDKLTGSKKLPLKARTILDNILQSKISKSKEFGKCLGIKNLGILFESELKIDFLGLLDNYSKTSVLFIQWDGETDNNCLYFLTKEKGKRIDIKNLSHITI